MSVHPYHRDATIFFILVAVFASGSIILFLLFALGQEKRITTYEECAKSRTSKILEMYPSICITAGGKRFIQPVEDNMVSPIPPEEQKTDFSTASSSAQTYVDPETPFTFTIPPGWVVNKIETSAKIDRNAVQALEIKQSDETRVYPIGRLEIDYTRMDAGFALEAWRNNFIPAGVPFGPYSETIAGIPFSKVESSESGGFIEGFSTDSYFGKNDEKQVAIGIFSHYQDEKEKTEQKNILSSVSFDTSQLQSYANSILGFSFQYPSGYDIEDLTNVPGNMTVMVGKEDQMKEWKMYGRKGNPVFPVAITFSVEKPVYKTNEFEQVSSQNITVDGIKAVKHSRKIRITNEYGTEGDVLTSIVVPTKNGYLDIRNFTPSQDSSLYSKILSTFQVTR